MIIEEDNVTGEPQQQGQAEGLRNGRSGSSRYAVLQNLAFLGFFMQPYEYPIRPLRPYPSPILPSLIASPKRVSQFIPASRQGRELKEGRWGIPIDDSLSFLGEQVEIVGSSNGFLLCRANPELNMELFACDGQNMDYIVCNPVSKQFQRLPRPHRPYVRALLAFICKTLHDEEEIQYEVIRAGEQSPGQFSTILQIETYSSVTNTWTETTLVSDLPFIFTVAFPTAIVVENVVFWNAQYCYAQYSHENSLLAYDRSSSEMGLPSARVILPPPSGSHGQRFVCSSDRYGSSEGKVHYARVRYSTLEIWVLEDCRRADWVLLRRVDSQMARWLTWPHQIQSFHPQNSQLLFITIIGKPFWFHVPTMHTTEIFSCMMPSSSRYFLYEWPL